MNSAAAATLTEPAYQTNGTLPGVDRLRRRGRVQTAAIVAAGMLAIASLGLILAADTGILPQPLSPGMLVAIGAMVTLVLGGVFALLLLEIGRRTDREIRLAHEQAMLAAEMRRANAAQQQLRDSQARLHDYARMASDWFWEQDADLRFTSIGNETPLLLPGDRSHLGRRRWEMNDTSQAPEHWEKHQRDLTERRPFRNFRYSRIGPQGTVVHVSINGVPVFDDTGGFLGYRGTGRDITREVNAEAELLAAKERAEKAENLLRDAVDSIAEGFVIYDHEDRLVLCNEAYRRMYPRAAVGMVSGNRFEDILRNGLLGGDYPAAIGREAEFLAERMQHHNTAKGETEHQLSNGRWVLITERRMRNGGLAGLRIDISQLKQAQFALQASEARVRDFAATSSDWFWEQDAELRFTWISDTCPFLNAGAANYQGKRRWDFPTARETPDEQWVTHRAVLQARQPFRDMRYVMSDEQGRRRHVTVSGNPVFDATGKFLGYRGTGREITAEVNAEIQLREAKNRAEQAENLLRDAVDSLSEGFVIFDRDDGFVMCNETYRQLYGPGADVLVPGTRFEDLVRRVLSGGGHPDAQGREREWLATRLRLHRETQGSIEERLTEDLWILATDRRMKNGGTAGLRVNISALKQAQAALRDSEARLARAQEIARIGSWELDVANGRYIWSEELYRIRGLSPDSFQPDSQNVALYVHPDDLPLQRRWLADLCNGVERDPMEIRIVRPDGNVRTLHIEGRAVTEPDGRIRRLSGTMQDITETRLMEQQLAQAQKMEAIGKLTGGMAHDFNNVLGVVIGNLELLGRVIGDHAMARELHAEALEGAQRGAELTRRLLAFARRQPLHPQPTEVNALVEGLVRLLSRILGENIDLRLRLGESLPPILVDPMQLEAALTNLATNARDAMPQGGRLEIATRLARLDAGYTAQHSEVRPGEYVLIEVSDTGSGIPKDLLGRIFEPFFTTKEPGRGSGLGLSMVFGFMKQSGGHVSVYTEERRGTTFRLYLPPGHGRETPHSIDTPTVALPRGHETILLVEDNASLRRVTVQQLRELGYAVLEADNAVSALAVLGSTQPVDLLFTDVVMPGSMDGLELARRATELRPDMPVLLSSGFPDARSVNAQTRTTDLPLINKPYRQAELAGLLRDLLDNSALSYAND